MRVVVTGAMNAYGKAIAHALAEAGHEVRAFGVPPGAQPFGDMPIATFPGTLEIGGSVEPVASECQAFVHAACFDAPLPDARRQAFHVERGTLYARYSAERELVDSFVAVLPPTAPRGMSKAFADAEAHVQGTRSNIPHAIVRAASPEAAAEAVVAHLRTARVAA